MVKLIEQVQDKTCEDNEKEVKEIANVETEENAASQNESENGQESEEDNKMGSETTRDENNTITFEEDRKSVDTNGIKTQIVKVGASEEQVEEGDLEEDNSEDITAVADNIDSSSKKKNATKRKAKNITNKLETNSTTALSKEPREVADSFGKRRRSSSRLMNQEKGTKLSDEISSDNLIDIMKKK